MTAATQSYSIDLGLPSSPNVPDTQIREELQYIYSALQILAREASNVNRFIGMVVEDITAGQYVAPTLSGGLCKFQKANAANNTKPAVGFATQNIASGTWGIFAREGNNLFLTGLTVASFYYLSDITSGAVTTVKPVGAGKIVQPIGFALSSIELITNIASNYTQL